MENTFDEVGSLRKIHSDGYINYYLKKTAIWACPGVEPGTSLSENHATRPTGIS